MPPRSPPRKSPTRIMSLGFPAKRRTRSCGTRCRFSRCFASIRARKWGSWSRATRSEEHTSELQSLMRTSYAVFCLKKKPNHTVVEDDEQPVTKGNMDKRAKQHNIKKIINRQAKREQD